jgi:hypothetical protein
METCIPFGGSMYSIVYNPKKQRIARIIINRGIIEVEEWETIQKMVEKINDGENKDYEFLVLDFNYDRILLGYASGSQCMAFSIVKNLMTKLEDLVFKREEILTKSFEKINKEISTYDIERKELILEILKECSDLEQEELNILISWVRRNPTSYLD